MNNHEIPLHRRQRSRTARGILGIIASLSASAFIFVVLEGVASSLLFLHALWKGIELPVMAERPHPAYDPELGWVGIPSVRIDDMYGPGE
jgi:hypothetical protein